VKGSQRSSLFKNYKTCIYLSCYTCLGLIFFFIFVSTLSAEKTSGNDAVQYLKKLNLEDLINVEVMSVSKKSEKLFETHAAIFVITNEDIKRSGATNIPEALRMVPGIEVAKIDSNKWAITSRGFSGRFANKLLVLIDGRSVYTPLFSGVFWDVQDTVMEDIDRIEIIRGPGATLWGANAVNGVINIITRHSKKTKGWLFSGGAGTMEKGFGCIRYGDKLGDESSYRIYAKYFDRDNSYDHSGNHQSDDWHFLQGGFRIDLKGNDKRNLLTFQADAYNGKSGQTISLPKFSFPYSDKVIEDAKKTGNNVLFKWNHIISDSSDFAFQLYYDQIRHKESIIDQHQNIFDLDFQHKFLIFKRHEIVWGAGIRRISDNLRNSSSSVSFIPEKMDFNLLSVFVQDSIKLTDDSLRLTIGSKFEDNDYTGFEYQPNIRISWKSNDKHFTWASVARAVRIPSRAENNGIIYLNILPPNSYDNSDNLPKVISLYGNKSYDSEKLLSYEIGYRFHPVSRLSFDAAMFYNKYDNFRSGIYQTPFFKTSAAPNHIVVPLIVANSAYGKTYGAEISVDYKPLDKLFCRIAYSYIDIEINKKNINDELLSKADTNTPSHQISFRSSFDFIKNWEIDTWVRYVDRISYGDIDSYITFDIRLGWKVNKHLEIAVAGQNLADKQHPEYIPELINTSTTEVKRSVYGKITCFF